MKRKHLTMKISISLIFCLVIYSCAMSQDMNMISGSDFENIKINGITIKEIRGTNGEPAKVTALFGEPDSLQMDDTPGDFSASYDYEGFHLGFSALVSGAEGRFSRFEISDSRPVLIISGTEIKVGDSIAKLGSMKTRKNSILIQAIDDSTAIISIDYNFETNIINSIIYFVLT